MKIKIIYSSFLIILLSLVIGGCGAGIGGDAGGPSGSAPNAPSGLTVSQTTSSSVKLVWNASGGAFSYTVYRNGVAIGYTSQTGAAQNAAPTTYTDTGRAAGTTYSYAVSASDLLGSESSKSSSVNAVTLSSGTTSGGYTLQSGETMPTSLTTNMISGKTFYWAKSAAYYGQITFPADASGNSMSGIDTEIGPSVYSFTTSWVAVSILPNSMPIIVTDYSSTGNPAYINTLNIVAIGSSYYVVSWSIANYPPTFYARLYYGSTAQANAKTYAGF